MPENKVALVQHYQKSREDLLAAIAGLSDELMTEPSIDGWSVKDHLFHIAFWDDIRTSEVVRISAGHASAWKLNAKQEDALNETSYSLHEDLSLDQARWELASSRQHLLDAIAAATERGLDGSRYGEAGLKSGHEIQHTGWIKRWRKEKGV